MTIAPETIPELEPEIEVTAKALPRVGLMAILCVTLGIILSVEAVVRGFFGTISGAVGWIPYLGGVITEPIEKIEQKIVSMLSGLEQDIDKALAHNIHVTAALLTKLWHELEHMALAIIILGALSTAAVFHYLIHPLQRYVHTAIKRLEALFAHPIRTLENALHALKHEIRHVVEPAVKIAIRAVPRYLHRELHAIRKDVAKVQKTATRALNEVESIPFPQNVTTWAEAVAVALPALGLDWLNCKSNPFNKNNAACGIWNDFKKLLGLFIDLLFFTHICELLPPLEALVGEVADPLVVGLTDIGAGLCKGGIGVAPTLAVPALSLPANPGITLNLP